MCVVQPLGHDVVLHEATASLEAVSWTTSAMPTSCEGLPSSVASLPAGPSMPGALSPPPTLDSRVGRRPAVASVAVTVGERAQARDARAPSEGTAQQHEPRSCSNDPPHHTKTTSLPWPGPDPRRRLRRARGRDAIS